MDGYREEGKEVNRRKRRGICTTHVIYKENKNEYTPFIPEHAAGSSDDDPVANAKASVPLMEPVLFKIMLLHLDVKLL
jgi:hypothetical protein